MTVRAIRGWAWVHRWSSLVCTAFLLMLCVTGLPLIFHDEIDRLAGHAPAASAGPASSGEGPGLLPLDAILARALAARPGEMPLFMAFSNDSPIITVTTGPAPDAPETAMTLQLFDRGTGRPAGAAEGGSGVMEVMLRLHVDMFAGLPGKLFLGAMGALFVVAIVSGAVLYAPFTRRLDFGALRKDRSRRVKWLDHHNLLGVVTLAWAAVVGATGVVNALSEPIVQAWRADELQRMTGGGAPERVATPAASLDAAVAAVRRARPGLKPQFIAWPGGAFSSARDYAIFLQGATPATERLLTIALVDAETGALGEVRPLPWTMQALLLSQPLHFGDYGGLPMKLLWAVLDLFTIAVLGSGLYLWIARRRSWGRGVAKRADDAPLAWAPAE